MKFILSILMICLLTLSTAIAAEKTDSGTGTVTEAIDVGSYTYLRLKEQGIWIAASRLPVVVGDKVKFSGGMEMRDFYSRTLDRTFESVFFVQMAHRVGQDVDNIHRAAKEAEGHGAENRVFQKSVSVQVPAPGEIPPLADGKTIADILEGSAQLKDQSVSLRARVIKVNQSIMGKNWITLQDGTGTKPNNKLIATSLELVSPGDLVIASGVLRNDIDLGSGYTYKVMLENTTFSQSKVAP
ncbi:hypothetical protein DJ031_15140 [bacterium endosymbiont of Escarpia laminata]|nr:MAG: hypothetical protein DJ031_15140 [bacterium endosymbiont of Escarpia laminata]